MSAHTIDFEQHLAASRARKGQTGKAFEAFRQRQEEVREAESYLSGRHALLFAPVRFPPIPFETEEARAAAEMEVGLFPIDAQAPNPGAARVAYYGATDRSQSARRAQLEEGIEWGPEVRRAALLPDGEGGVRSVILTGKLSAVQQAAPDQALLDIYAEAGVKDFTVLDHVVERAEGHRVRVGKRVPLSEAPRPLQIETESRGKVQTHTL